MVLGNSSVCRYDDGLLYHMRVDKSQPAVSAPSLCVPPWPANFPIDVPLVLWVQSSIEDGDGIFQAASVIERDGQWMKSFIFVELKDHNRRTRIP